MTIMYNYTGRTVDEEQAVVKYDRGSETVYLFSWISNEFEPFSITECQTIIKLYEMDMLNLYFVRDIGKPLQMLFKDMEKDFK